MVDAYARALADPDPDVHAAAAAAWCAWEDVHVSLDPAHRPDPRYADPEFAAVFATLVTHYWSHSGFGGDDLLAGMGRIAHLPGVLVHGRYDVSSPLQTAWQLHWAWPGSRLVVVDEGHGGSAMMEHVAGAIAALTTRH